MSSSSIRLGIETDIERQSSPATSLRTSSSFASSPPLNALSESSYASSEPGDIQLVSKFFSMIFMPDEIAKEDEGECLLNSSHDEKVCNVVFIISSAKFISS